MISLQVFGLNLTADLFAVLILAGIAAIPIYLFRRFIWKRVGKGGNILTYAIIDDQRIYHEGQVNRSELKVIAKQEWFEYSKDENYLVMREAVGTRKGKPYIEWNAHEPIPRIFGADAATLSAAEVKEIAESKVVFDLLRFTLSKIESTFVILAIITVIEGAINIYLVYTTGQNVNTLNTLVAKVVAYLFPNG